VSILQKLNCLLLFSFMWLNVRKVHRIVAWCKLPLLYQLALDLRVCEPVSHSEPYTIFNSAHSILKIVAQHSQDLGMRLIFTMVCVWCCSQWLYSGYTSSISIQSWFVSGICMKCP
jgi:hypothetical protein